MRVGKAKNREQPMVTSIYYPCEEPLLILGNLVIFRARPGRGATEVLPALQSRFLEELHALRLIWEANDKFVACSVISITFSFGVIYLPPVIPLGPRRLTPGRNQLYDIVI
jgi:hypothetical protein